MATRKQIRVTAAESNYGAKAASRLFKIKMGAKVKDVITGFVGVVTARTEWLSGCVRYLVSPQKLDKEGKPVEGQWIDEQQLGLMTGGVKLAARPAGGPKPAATRPRDPQRS